MDHCWTLKIMDHCWTLKIPNHAVFFKTFRLRSTDHHRSLPLHSFLCFWSGCHSMGHQLRGTLIVNPKIVLNITPFSAQCTKAIARKTLYFGVTLPLNSVLLSCTLDWRLSLWYMILYLRSRIYSIQKRSQRSSWCILSYSSNRPGAFHPIFLIVLVH